MATFGSLFSGEGLADLGAIAAGLDLKFGVELDPRRAAIGSKATGHAIAVGDVALVQDLPKVDLLWASPPCQKFSRVNLINGGEGDHEEAIAAGIIRHVREIKPRGFVLENVPQYAKSRSLAAIEDALFGEGYWVQRSILCPSDYGVPQTRPRLILRATRGGAGIPEIPLHPRVVGWGDVLGDLVDGFAPYQLPPSTAKHLEWVEGDGMVGAGNAGIGWHRVRPANEPAFAVTTRHQQALHLGKGWRKLSLQAIARLQTVPDAIAPLLTKTGLGNGVPCLFAKQILESLL